MRIAVVGAGIVGVTTAYELARSGHEVTVFERRSSVAEESSFANAGVIAPGYVTPWAAPGMPLKVVGQLLRSHAAVRLGGPGVLTQLPWLWRWWRACRRTVHEANRSAMQELALFSRQRLEELSKELSLEFEQRRGYLVLLRSAREVHEAQNGLKLLERQGIAHALVDAAACRRLEPGLNPETRLQGAIHLPLDGLGNCRHFAHLLKNEAQRLGAVFRFDTEVRSLSAGPAPKLRLLTGGEEAFDAVVICAGVQANRLLKPLHIALPLLPVYGYSVTAPLRFVEGHPDLGPQAALMDERFKVAISRLGQRVRVAGSAELGGNASDISAAPLRTLYRVLDDWFPGAVHLQQAQVWKGARPMLPDGPPVLGASGLPGVWLNLGHGASGWALSCGSAKVLSEVISGRSAPMDLARLSMARLQLRTFAT